MIDLIILYVIDYIGRYMNVKNLCQRGWGLWGDKICVALAALNLKTAMNVRYNYYQKYQRIYIRVGNQK